MRAEELAARGHSVDPPTCTREIGKLVRVRERGRVDLAEEVSLGILARVFDLEVECDRDEVVLDDLEIRVAEEPEPSCSKYGSNNGIQDLAADGRILRRFGTNRIVSWPGHGRFSGATLSFPGPS